MNSEEQKRFDWIKSVYGDWEEYKFMVQIVERLETVLKLVQRWGKDSRSVGAYEVFAEVAKALDGKPEHPMTVVDCTCIPCVCPPNDEDRCLGCGARTCLAHELALKGGSR